MMSARRGLFSSQLSKEIPDVNVVILGSLGVGKSAFTVKYLTKRFIVEYDPNLEDTYQKTETVDGQDFIIRLMDTAQHSDPNRLEKHIKWAHGVLIMYSITSRSSFDTALGILDHVIENLREHARFTPFMLVANKTDMERYRTVSKLEGEEAALKYDCSFQEASAADDFQSVEKVVHELLRDIGRSHDAQETLQPLFITEDNNQKTTASSSHSRAQGFSSMIYKRGKQTTSTEKHGVEKDGGKAAPKKLPFKIFNKRFNIF